MTARCMVTSKSVCWRQRRLLSTQFAPLPWKGWVYLSRFSYIITFSIFRWSFRVEFNPWCCISLHSTTLWRCYLAELELELKVFTFIAGIRCLTGLGADGHEVRVLNWEELTSAAMWMPMPSFQRSRYSVVPLMASFLSISWGDLSLERLRATLQWQWHKQHYHHTVTFALPGHMLLLIQIGMNLGTGDSLFFKALFFFFVDFCLQQIFAVRSLTLSSLYGRGNCCVTLAASHQREETSQHSPFSREPP